MTNPWIVMMMLAACGPRELAPASEQRSMCAAMCALVACEGEIGSEAITGCSERCVEMWAMTREVSDACEESYEQSLACVSMLECSQVHAWTSEEESLCRAPLDAFGAECPGMTFDFRE